MTVFMETKTMPKYQTSDFVPYVGNIDLLDQVHHLFFKNPEMNIIALSVAKINPIINYEPMKEMKRFNSSWFDSIVSQEDALYEFSGKELADAMNDLPPQVFGMDESDNVICSFKTMYKEHKDPSHPFETTKAFIVQVM